jgi:hypothetical protein
MTEFFTILEILFLSAHLQMRHSRDMAKSQGDSGA